MKLTLPISFSFIFLEEKYHPNQITFFILEFTLHLWKLPFSCTTLKNLLSRKIFFAEKGNDNEELCPLQTKWRSRAMMQLCTTTTFTTRSAQHIIIVHTKNSISFHENSKLEKLLKSIERWNDYYEKHVKKSR